MSTVNAMNVKHGVVDAQGFVSLQAKVTDSLASINQGDLVYWDGTAGIAKSVDTDGHAATLLGVALQPSKISSSVDNSSAPAVKTIQVGSKVVADLKTTAAETYTHLQAVYIGADAQTITNVAATNKIGLVYLPSTVSSVLGASGVKVQVLVFSHMLQE